LSGFRSRTLLFSALAVVVALFAAASASAANPPPGFTDTPIFTNIDQPTSFRFGPEGRVFVAEKTGDILVYESLADPIPEVFDDLQIPVYDTGDRGLLAIELDPEFPVKPYVYALYTYNHVLYEPSRPTPAWVNEDLEPTGDPCPKPADTPGVDACPVSGRLVRIEAEEEGGELHAGEEKVLLEGWCQQDSSHSIGDLGFGPEGALFVTGGDGASFSNLDYGQYGWPHLNQCGDPPGTASQVENNTTFELTPPTAEGGALRAQDVRTLTDPVGLNGALLRIDPETGEGWPTNPMHESSDPNLRRIIGYGFRNPFRFAVDAHNGDVFVDHVGWETYEEIDKVPIESAKLYNSGWPCYEGNRPQPSYAAAELGLCENLYKEPGSTEEPFYFYDHLGPVTPGDECSIKEGSAISGVLPYEGEDLPPEYQHALFFADSVRGCIYVMRADEDGEPDISQAEPFLTEGGPYPGIDIQEGPEGAIYYSSLESPEDGLGGIHRVVFDTKSPQAKLRTEEGTPPYGPSPLEVFFNAGESTPSEESGPEGELEYDWDLDGNGTFETHGGAVHAATFTGSVNKTVSVKVTDVGTGESSIATINVFPNDEPPEVFIGQPNEEESWGVGQEFHFAGWAYEFTGHEEVGYLNLSWKTRILHCPFGEGCHKHPLQVFPSTGEGDLIAPEHDYPSYIEFALTATDNRGLANTETIKLKARPVTVTLATDPANAGAEIVAGGHDQVAPYSFEAIEDSTLLLSAPKSVTVGGNTYPFKEWSDGGGRVHSVKVHESSEFKAIYDVPKEEEPGEHKPVVPQPKLKKHPAKKTKSHKATFKFSASGSTKLSFECKLDKGKPQRCRSPKTYKGLKPGSHTFKVWATEAGTNRRGETTTFKWKVL
jgi:glucose/arabinose dehydrogenase